MKATNRKVKIHVSNFNRIFIFASAAFLVVQIFLANSLSVQGKEISNLENFRGGLESNLSDLRQKSARLSSLDSIRTLAKEKLGMVEGSDDFDYLGSSVALR